MKSEPTSRSHRIAVFHRKTIRFFNLARQGRGFPIPRFLLAAGLLAAPALAADTELTNYKTGIDLHFGNSASTATDKGTAYAEEYLYFDKMLDDHKIVYIKAGTAITMSHNSRNISGNPDGSDSYAAAATNIGQIRYKVDGDHKFNVNPLSWTAYTAPLAFKDMDYGFYGDSGTKVVGTTGDNGVAQTLENKLTRYHRGMLDSVGDEWHTLTVADDDSAVTANNEFKSSDGKIWYFVVNPKTPCLTWRTSGSGQFYTSPPKTYFIPKIYDQTTYFSGTVTCEIRDINGNHVFYRVNGGSFINAGKNHVTLDQGAFNNGNNTLEYYYAGNAAHTKIRKVVKNPDYPSAKESHGNRLWVDSTQWTNEVKPNLTGNPDKAWWLDQWKRGNKTASHAAINTGTRIGKRSTPGEAAFPNALIAKIYGMTYKYGTAAQTAADFAKLALLDTHTVLDPIGIELNTSNGPVPTRELVYRGYYDTRPIFSLAAAYDILAGDYRANQGFANGLTAIEDYFIRDSLARWVHISGMHTGGWNAPVWYVLDGGGMWDTAHKIGGAMVACMMPAYSTEYYGTCGLDGNPRTFNSATFPTLNHRWFDLYLDNNVTPTGFPNVAARIGVDDYLFLANGKWHDRIPYAHTPLMGQAFGLYYNLIKLFHPTKVLPRVDAAMTAAGSGQLYGSKFTNSADESPKFYPWAIMSNAWFPEFRSAVAANATTKQISDEYNTGGAFYVLWHDLNLPLGSAPPPVPAPVAATPVFSPPGGNYTSAQNVTISTATPGATIRYTTNGTDPTYSNGTIYTSPVAISSTTTLKAIAYSGPNDGSPVHAGAYQISSVVELPDISPAGGSYLSEQQISITCATPGAVILYTTDGSEPTPQSATYTGPFAVKANMTIRAIGAKAGSQTSGVKTETYQIGSVSSTDSIWTGGDIGGTDGIFSVSFTITPGTNSLVGLASAKTGNFADLAAIVRFSPEGVVDARNGGVYEANTVLPYTPGNTYKVLMSVDMTSRRYSVTVTPPDAASVMIATNYAFRSEQAAVASLGHLAVWSQVGLATVSDLNIGTRPPPPTGLKLLDPQGEPGK